MSLDMDSIMFGKAQYDLSEREEAEDLRLLDPDYEEEQDAWATDTSMEIPEEDPYFDGEINPEEMSYALKMPVSPDQLIR